MVLPTRARSWKRRRRPRYTCTPPRQCSTPLVILSRGHATEALAWTRWAMQQLGLALNDGKTCLRNAQRERFDFLGYTFGLEHYRKDGHTYLAAKPSKKSVHRLKTAVHAVLRTNGQAPWSDVVARLNRLLRGWARYFSYGTRLMAYRAADDYVYSSVRRFLTRRHKVRTRGT